MALASGLVAAFLAALPTARAAACTTSGTAARTGPAATAPALAGSAARRSSAARAALS